MVMKAAAGRARIMVDQIDFSGGRGGRWGVEWGRRRAVKFTQAHTR